MQVLAAVEIADAEAPPPGERPARLENPPPRLIEPSRPRPEPARAPALNPEAPATPPAPRVQLFRWFENEFNNLRVELHDLVGTVAQQQAMLAELSEDRHAQLRLSLLAESLPDTLNDAVRTSVKEEVGSVSASVEGAVENLRASINRAETASSERRADTELLDSALGSLREAMVGLEQTVRVQQEELDRELPKLRAMRSTLTRHLRDLIEAVPVTVIESVQPLLESQANSMEQRLTVLVEGVRAELASDSLAANLALRETIEIQATELRTLKGSLTRQLRPLAEIVER
ncbi:MAG: hypothetical protein ACRDRT_05215, partial [Pseudonocardiaceae bacterium]